MNSKRVFLLLNGARPQIELNLRAYQFVCAIDGAFEYFLEQDIIPDLVTGDMDSIRTIPKHIETILTPDQNFTDFEKALQILADRGYRNIDIYGGSGKEHDHFLGNLSTALKWNGQLNLTFFDDFGSYFFIGQNWSTTDVIDKTISIIPFPSATGINTSGLQYPLQNGSLHFGERIGTRNKAVEDTIHISFKTGNLLVYIGNP